MRRRILYLAEALVISLEIWMGLMASLIYTPVAVLVLPAFVLAVIGAARPGALATRRGLRIYLHAAAGVALALVGDQAVFWLRR